MTNDWLKSTNLIRLRIRSTHFVDISDKFKPTIEYLTIMRNHLADQKCTQNELNE